jgi:hypothetical protein
MKISLTFPLAEHYFYRYSVIVICMLVQALTVVLEIFGESIFT